MRNGYVLDWILEASKLLKEAQENDTKTIGLNGDIWHQRVKNLLKPIDIKAHPNG